MEAVADLVGVDADQRGLHGLTARTKSVPPIAPSASGKDSGAAGRSSARTGGFGRRGSPTSGSATRGSPSETPAPSGVLANAGSMSSSYTPWPNSWIVENSDLMSGSSVCVVRRMSPAPGFDANGCGVSSSRHELGSQPSLEHQPSGLLLRCNGKRALQILDDVVAMTLDELDELALQPPEDLLDLRGRHPLLVFVEQRVVRLVNLREARDVSMLQLQLPLEMRPEESEVGGLLRVVPRRDADAVRLGQLAREVRRDPSRAVPLAAGDANERSVRRVGILVGGEPLEKLTHLVGDEPLVRKLREGRGHISARVGSPARHRDTRIPIEDLLRVSEVGELGEDFLQPLERRLGRRRGAQTACGASFSRR